MTPPCTSAPPCAPPRPSGSLKLAGLGMFTPRKLANWLRPFPPAHQSRFLNFSQPAAGTGVCKEVQAEPEGWVDREPCWGQSGPPTRVTRAVGQQLFWKLLPTPVPTHAQISGVDLKRQRHFASGCRRAGTRRRPFSLDCVTMVNTVSLGRRPTWNTAAHTSTVSLR